MLCFTNGTSESVYLEGGELVAEGRVIPPQAEFSRKSELKRFAAKRRRSGALVALGARRRFYQGHP